MVRASLVYINILRNNLRFEREILIDGCSDVTLTTAYAVCFPNKPLTTAFCKASTPRSWLRYVRAIFIPVPSIFVITIATLRAEYFNTDR